MRNSFILVVFLFLTGGTVRFTEVQVQTLTINDYNTSLALISKIINVVGKFCIEIFTTRVNLAKKFPCTMFFESVFSVLIWVY